MVYPTGRECINVTLRARFKTSAGVVLFNMMLLVRIAGFSIFWISLLNAMVRDGAKRRVTMTALGIVMGVLYGVSINAPSIISYLVTLSSVVAGVSGVLLYLGLRKR